ncbi:hypothetical protein [Nocardioides jishulii]|uniref:Uncharacterized protein n=1 Tax=Nocardioides jishulii TaxID=2575440 RepID=A0A4U2YRB1_9ACTN|nr:hypothetical protein [Nocardioides jishulii]QCX26247.1 hypothetical protein FCL41_00850 [Nocardioides jishulii]TKI63949.1 hypothetical protein FC770_01855 [Nocardioides jishulii]
MTIRIMGVDERDSAWEDEQPRFRVYFQYPGEQPSVDSMAGMWTATYDVTGADVLQVVDWAQRRAGDELVYSVALVLDRPHRFPGDERGLLWVVGMDANDSYPDAAQREVKRRMLARRRDPVRVGPDDRMPDSATIAE